MCLKIYNFASDEFWKQKCFFLLQFDHDFQLKDPKGEESKGAKASRKKFL